MGEVLRGDRRQKLLRCPAGALPVFGGATGGRARCSGLPPANFLRDPSGTKSEALATILWSSDDGQGNGKSLVAQEDCPELQQR